MLIMSQKNTVKDCKENGLRVKELAMRFSL